LQSKLAEDVVNWPNWICPEHKIALARTASGTLACPKNHAFNVENDIPRFVSGATYVDHFGAQWNQYRLTQLDSFTDSPMSRNRARRCIGESAWKDLQGARVLECGCGAGRFTEILLDQGAYVTSIDLSTAVDANAINFPVSDSHRIAQADLMLLPFQPRQFDVVFCLGVIQHTPDPSTTLSKLYEQVAPGGTLVIDHYAYSFSWYTKTAPLFRFFLKRFSCERSMRVTEWLVDTFLPLQKRVANRPLARAIVHRISPVLSYYVTNPELNEVLQREWALLDTHDSLTDWYKHFRTRKQIHLALEDLGLESIWCEYGGNGVEAHGMRPVSTCAMPSIL
jgi:SAM-dependent methyltransferase